MGESEAVDEDGSEQSEPGPDENDEPSEVINDELFDDDDGADFEDFPDGLYSPTPVVAFLPSRMAIDQPDKGDADLEEDYFPLAPARRLDLTPISISSAIDRERSRPPVLNAMSGSKITKPRSRSTSPSKKVLARVAKLELSSSQAK
jgi:hypothetical protein